MKGREPDERAAAARELARCVRDARERTFALVADLSDEQLLGPRLAIVNPLLWEIGHVAWFQEKWALRHAAGREPIRADGDALYDSAAVAHDTRWDLLLPSREETLAYMRAVRDRVVERLEEGPLEEKDFYFARLSVFHEDMHDEAIAYTRQTHGWPAPRLPAAEGAVASASPAADDASGNAEVPGGRFLLGASPNETFVFDNEKWEHAVELEPFAIARRAVTQGEFAAFVEEGGYRRAELWSEEGARWLASSGATGPLHWKREGNGRFFRRHFDRWVPLEADLPVLHVNAFEAEAFCRFAGRRLPTEAEWEAAAAAEPSEGGRALSTRKRRFPWGEDAPDPSRANLDGAAGGTIPADALPASESAFGCRQMIGNAWEWTASAFLPYPGFEIDPYREYSEPWFGTHRVLRGGCWITRGRLLRNTWRNFYTPDRRDVWAGFRTAALRS